MLGEDNTPELLLTAIPSWQPTFELLDLDLTLSSPIPPCTFKSDDCPPMSCVVQMTMDGSPLVPSSCDTGTEALNPKAPKQEDPEPAAPATRARTRVKRSDATRSNKQHRNQKDQVASKSKVDDQLEVRPRPCAAVRCKEKEEMHPRLSVGLVYCDKHRCNSDRACDHKKTCFTPFRVGLKVRGGCTEAALAAKSRVHVRRCEDCRLKEARRQAGFNYSYTGGVPKNRKRRRCSSLSDSDASDS